jgi:hypothetical protein
VADPSPVSIADRARKIQRTLLRNRLGLAACVAHTIGEG